MTEEHATMIIRSTPRGTLIFWQDDDGDLMNKGTGSWSPLEYEAEWRDAFDAYWRAHNPGVTDHAAGMKSHPFAPARN